MPQRIQRKRTKGWRMPEGAVYVGRPTRWGNPYAADGDQESVVRVYRSTIGGLMKIHIRNHLRGKDLACWCPLDRPCHADVLLEIANS